MTVGELAELYIDSSDNMAIWSSESERIVFSGTFDEVMISEYSDEEVGSFGIEGQIIVINI